MQDRAYVRPSFSKSELMQGRALASPNLCKAKIMQVPAYEKTNLSNNKLINSQDHTFGKIELLSHLRMYLKTKPQDEKSLKTLICSLEMTP